MPTQVEALTGFDHHGSRRRGDKFPTSDQTAKDLVRAGLVRIVTDRPEKAAGKPSSASPAAQASPQKTSSSSKGGGKKQPQKPAGAAS